MEFDRYSFVLLKRGPQALELSEAEVDRLQEQHLAHLQEMGRRGALLVAGPFRDQEDETKRGICVYRTGLEETRRLAEQDPAVQAGRMAVEVMTWLTEQGALDFPRAHTTTEEEPA